MKKICNFIPLMIGFFFSQLVFAQNPNEDKFWNLLNVKKSPLKGAEFFANSIEVNSNGVILAVGYNDEKNFNTPSGIPDRYFKIFKSIDFGETWKDISKDSICSYYTKMDLFDGARLFFNGSLFSSGKAFFLSYSGGYFKSEDDGESWINIADTDAEIIKDSPWFIREDLRTYQAWGSRKIWKKSSNSWIKIYDNFYKMVNDTSYYVYEGQNIELYNTPEKKLKGDVDKYYVGQNCEILFPKRKQSGYFPCGGTLYEIYTENIQSNTYFTVFGSDMNGNGQLYISNNGGKTFEKVKSNVFGGVFNLFPVCNNQNIFLLGVSEENKHKMFGSVDYAQLYLSTDKGKSWKQIENPGMINDFTYAPDGHVIVCTKEGLKKSIKKYGCSNQSVPEPEPQFGTTIITHGYQFGGTPPTTQSDWTFQMALEIIKKHGKGTIKTYQKSTGSFETDTEVGVGGETVLLFDWAEESNNNTHGYSEAAGDALFAALMMGHKKGNIKLENLHFIGHSRGCVVNTECVERLLTIGIKIDHVTFIDPHDWGGGDYLNLNIANDWDNHPNLNIPFPQKPRDTRPNNGVIAWEGVEYVESYWQSNHLLTANILDGRPVDGAANFDWNSYSTGHINIHDIYINSISGNLPSQAGGYKYARLGNEYSNRPKANSPHPNKYTTRFDFFNSMIIPGRLDRVRGIMNGGFDRGGNDNTATLPGWLHHGGSIKGESIVFKSGSISMTDTVSNENSNPIIRHNRFYVPTDAKSISFKYKRLKDDAGIITIKIISQTQTNKFQLNELAINKTRPNIAEDFVEIKNFAGDVIVLEIELSSLNGGFASIELDEVKFSKQFPVPVEQKKVNARAAVYFCNETGYYAYCYGVDDAETCAKNNCIRIGGRTPKLVGNTANEKGYGAIAMGKSSNGSFVIGAATGCASQIVAEQQAIALCKQNGGLEPYIDARFFDNNSTLESADNPWVMIPKSNNCKRLFYEKDKLWALGLNNGIYTFDGQNWNAYTGGGQGVDIAAHNGIPYVIGMDGNIYKGTGTSWTKLNSTGSGKSIFCDDETIWVIGGDDGIYYLKEGLWKTYPGNGQGFDIAANNGVPYVVGLDNVIYKGTGSGWSPMSGQKGKRIFYESGKIWIIGIDDNIYYHDGMKWVPYPGNGKGIDISVINGIPYVVGLDNAIYKGK